MLPAPWLHPVSVPASSRCCKRWRPVSRRTLSPGTSSCPSAPSAGEQPSTPLPAAPLEERIQQTATALHERLTPADWRLSQQLRHLEELATRAACEARQRRLLEALA